VISLKNVSFQYKADALTRRPSPVLTQVNASFPNRSRVAILGGPSSGKTTLLNIICGSLRPNHGRVERNGSVSFPVGFVGASSSISVLNYIKFVAKCYCIDPTSFVRYVVQFAELEDVLFRPTGKLGAARRSRLNMTIGYALPFDHYLFDARIAVDDPAFQSKCLKLFEARQTIAGTILATRKASFARQYCTSAVVIYRNSVVYFEDIDRGIEFYDAIEPDPHSSRKNAHYVPTEVVNVEKG
jgi:capsular polysaccharide transport system ATP-binding protein